MGANRASKQRKLGGEHPAVDQGVLDTAERLKAMADPIRLQFLSEILDRPRTVKEVAEALEVPPTRLYYHLRILEGSGLIEVANRRMVSGIEERSYRAVAENLSLSANLAASSLYETGALRALFDFIRSEIEVALQAHPDASMEDPDSPLKALAMTELELVPGDLPRFMRDFEKLLSKYGGSAPPEGNPDRERFRFFYAIYPAPEAPVHGDES
jgi:DNA-binding transcriptional ArsR family regulator